MKTINGKKHNNIEVFRNNETQEICGFAGTVELYDSKIYVDTRNGTGYDDVITKLRPLIHKLATKYKFSGNTIKDTKHDVIVHILEGIPKYDPSKNTKLSTFLEMRVNRRLINELRDKSRISKNATYLNTGLYNITCKCGNHFVVRCDPNCTDHKACGECGEEITKNTKKLSVNTPEINESSLEFEDSYGDILSEQVATLDKNNTSFDINVIFMHDMKEWLKNEDPRIVKIIELMYFKDYSIKAAAETVGLSGAGANMKLKELARNRIVRELFGR